MKNKSDSINFLIDEKKEKSYINNKYTRFVGLIKLIFLATAAALALLIVTWSFTGPNDKTITLSLNDSKQIENVYEGLTNGKFIGKDKNNQTYIITAIYAEPINGNPRQIALKKLQADLTLNDGTWITLKAPDGVLNRNQNKLTLED